MLQIHTELKMKKCIYGRAMAVIVGRVSSRSFEVFGELVGRDNGFTNHFVVQILCEANRWTHQNFKTSTRNAANNYRHRSTNQGEICIVLLGATSRMHQGGFYESYAPRVFLRVVCTKGDFSPLVHTTRSS